MVGAPPGTIPWGGRAHDRPENHGIHGQARGDRNPRSDHDGTGKFDHIIHGHWAHRRGLTGLCQVPLWGPHKNTNQLQVRDKASAGPGGGRGSILRSGGIFTDRNMPPPPQKEYGGVDLRCTVHGEWDGNRGKRMEGFCITMIRNQPYRPEPSLQYLQGWIQYIAFPWMQEGRPHHVSPQRSTWRELRPGQQGPQYYPHVKKPSSTQVNPCRSGRSLWTSNNQPTNP